MSSSFGFSSKSLQTGVQMPPGPGPGPCPGGANGKTSLAMSFGFVTAGVSGTSIAGVPGIVSIPKLKSQTLKLNSSSSSSSNSSSKSSANNDSIICELINIVNSSLLPINQVDGSRALVLLRSMLSEDSSDKSRGVSSMMGDTTTTASFASSSDTGSNTNTASSTTNNNTNDDDMASGSTAAAINQFKENQSKSQVQFDFIRSISVGQSAFKGFNSQQCSNSSSSNSNAAPSFTPLKRIDNIYLGGSTLVATQNTPFLRSTMKQPSIEPQSRANPLVPTTTPRRTAAHALQTPLADKRLSLSANNLNVTAERSPRYKEHKTPGYAKTPGAEADLWDDDFGGGGSGGGGVIYWDEYDRNSALGRCNIDEENETLGDNMNSSPIISNYASSSSSYGKVLNTIPNNIDDEMQKMDIASATAAESNKVVDDVSEISAKDVMPKRRFLAKSKKGINFLEMDAGTPIKYEGLNSVQASAFKTKDTSPQNENLTTSSKRSVKPMKGSGEISSNSKKKLPCKLSKSDSVDGEEEEMVSIPFDHLSARSGLGLGLFKAGAGIFDSTNISNITGTGGHISSYGFAALEAEKSSTMVIEESDNHIESIDKSSNSNSSSSSNNNNSSSSSSSNFNQQLVGSPPVVDFMCPEDDSIATSTNVGMYEGKSKKPSRRRVSVGGKKKGMVGGRANDEFDGLHGLDSFGGSSGGSSGGDGCDLKLNSESAISTATLPVGSLFSSGFSGPNPVIASNTVDIVDDTEEMQSAAYSAIEHEQEYETKSHRMSSRRRSISVKGAAAGSSSFFKKGTSGCSPSIALGDVNDEDNDEAFTGLVKQSSSIVDLTKPPLAVAASKRTFLKKSAVPPPASSVSIKNYFLSAPPVPTNSSFVAAAVTQLPSSTSVITTASVASTTIATIPSSNLSFSFGLDKKVSTGFGFIDRSCSVVTAKKSEQDYAKAAVQSIKLSTCLSFPVISDLYNNLISTMPYHLTRFVSLVRDKQTDQKIYSFKYISHLSAERITSKAVLDSSNVTLLALMSCVKEVISASSSESLKSTAISSMLFKSSSMDNDLITLFAPLLLLLSHNYRDFDLSLLPESAEEQANATIIENKSAKSRVRFAESDGHCICPPNDRQPDTWKMSYTEALRWHDILTVAELISKEISLKNVPMIAVLDRLRSYFSNETSNLKSLYENCLLSGNVSTLNSVSFSLRDMEMSLQSLCELFSDLALNSNSQSSSSRGSGSNSNSMMVSTTSSENATAIMRLPRVSISWRISWHNTSVLRSQLRWLLDPPLHFISSASITGQQGIYETYRSHFHETIQCTAIKKNVYTDFIVDNTNAWQDEKDAQSTDCYKPTETAELTLSYLISESLRQIHLFLRYNVMISFDNMKNLSTDAIDISCVSLLESATSSSIEEDTVYFAQLIIAAELARKFLNNLFSLSSFKQLVIDFEEKFAIIQDCCLTIHNVGCEDDLHWALLRSGIDGMRGVTSRPFISQHTIRKCKAIIKDYKTKVYDKRSSDLGFGIDEFIFDFPRLELN